MQALALDCCPPETKFVEPIPVFIQYGNTKYWTDKPCSCGWQVVIPYEFCDRPNHILFRCTNPSCAHNRRKLGDVSPLPLGYNEMFGV